MHRWTALILLLVGLAAAYLWQVTAFDPAYVWNASGATYRVLLLGLVAVAYKSTPVRLVCLLLSGCDLMVAGCSIAYLIQPWQVSPDQELCSSRLNMPLGLVGAVLALGLVIYIVRGKK